MMDTVYAQALRDLARAADGAGALAEPQVRVAVDNPLCGDRVTMDLTLADGRVAALAHKVRGCMLCEAAAAAIGRHALGAAPSRLRAVADGMRAMIRSGAPPPGDWQELAAFTPVHEIKSRHECVLLPFDALSQALDKASRALDPQS